MPDRSRHLPRRLRRIVALAFFLALAALALYAYLFSWSAPPTYTPSASITPKGTALTSPQHDARVTLLGDAPYLLNIESPSTHGRLLLFGSSHSKDPDHPQLDQLRRAWNEFHPTVALVEGRMSFFVGTSRQGIRIFGEGAAVYTLAHDSSIPLYTWEPPLEVELAALDTVGDRKQVALFRTLSGYISARRGAPVSNFKINRLLHRRAAPLTDELPTIEAFDAYFASQFPSVPNWRDLPEEAMWPGKADTFLHAMATTSNIARDDHFVRTILDLIAQGHRVFAIAGRSHPINLEPILWQSLQPATRGPLSSPRPWESN